MIVESGNIADIESKIDPMVSILSKLHYDAIGLGSMDIKLGDVFFKKAADNHLAIVDSFPDRADKTKPYIIKNIDGIKVGIVSFGAPPLQGHDSDDFQNRKALYAAYKDARSKSDLLVVLDQYNMVTKEWLGRNGPRFGYPDIVVGGSSKQGASDPEIIGKTQIVPTSLQGKNIGVIDVEIVPGLETRLAWKKIVLDDTVKDDPEVKKLVDAATEKKVHPGPDINVPIPPPGPTAKSYYPPVLCKTCHIKQYDDWAKTKHAVALKTLVDKDRTTPECLTCHSEQFRTMSKYSMPKNDNMAGVECATCHADSLPHGIERRNVTAKAKVDPQLCVTCHNKDNSPDYNEKTYMPKIAHTGASSPATTATATPAH